MKTKLARLFMPIILAFTLTSCTNDSSESHQIATGNNVVITHYNYNSDETDLMRIINDYRFSTGKNKFQLINHISFKSQEHNSYMIQHNVVNHANFDSRANNLRQVLGAVTVGENVAYNFSTPEAVFNAWLNSQEHKLNLDGDYTHFGLSVSTNSAGKKYYTNMFIKK